MRPGSKRNRMSTYSASARFGDSSSLFDRAKKGGCGRLFSARVVIIATLRRRAIFRTPFYFRSMGSVSMKAAIVVFAVTASAFALPAEAQLNMSALYVGGSVGQSHFRQGCTGLVSGVSSDEKDTAWRILPGYQITPTLSAELGYHNFREPKASLSSTSASITARARALVAVRLQPPSKPLRISRK